MALNTKSMELKFPCICCGHKTLENQEIGEICPVCFWEEDTTTSDGWFEVSSANHISLFEGQENYKRYTCCKPKHLDNCRQPTPGERADNDWISIQSTIEKNYSVENSCYEISKLAEVLMQKNAIAEFNNFKTLTEIHIASEQFQNRGEDLDEFTDDSDIISELFFLKALTINIANKDIALLLTTCLDYYQKGLNYYFTWSIILSVLAEYNQLPVTPQLTDILLNIENNNYYGLTSLENSVNKIWKCC